MNERNDGGEVDRWAYGTNGIEDIWACGIHERKYMWAFWVMTNLMHSFLMYLFYASACFEQQVLIIRRAKLY
jgi:hypothetical protein